MTLIILPTLATLTASWWRTAFTSPLMLWGLAVVLVSLLLIALCLRALWRLGKTHRQNRSLWSCLFNQQGTATLEFALVFPVLLFMILLLTQTTLVMGGNLFVHYSAFAAARTAMVQIPAAYGSPVDEPANVLVVSDTAGKINRIRRAAYFAVVPVCGRLSSGNAPAQQFVAALTEFYVGFGQQPPAWVTNGLLAERLQYAYENTWVNIYTTTVDPNSPRTVQLAVIDSTHTFGPKEPITVRVGHRLNLSIPYVRVLFADGRDSSQFDKGMKFTAESSSSTHHTTITAQYTLINEGISRDLPPRPTLNRQP